MGTPHEAEVATDLHERPVDILRELIRFETVNPPGNERPCIEWIGAVLDTYDIEHETYAKDPDRPNLLARVPGGDAPPLLLYGHVDVVPVTGQDWTHGPFEGVVEDGFVWGRGALDMKDGVAMFLAATLRLAISDEQPAGDILFLAVSDEEAGGDDGLRFLVEEHPELFEEVKYALGEFGGFSAEIAGAEVYPIQVNEKGICWLEVTFTGSSGHGSIPRTGTALSKLASFVDALDGDRLPVHVTPPAEAMIEALAEAAPADRRETLLTLLDPAKTDEVLDELGQEAVMLDAILHNTTVPTVVSGGDKENVIPESVTLVLDTRLLPGQTPEDAIEELRALTGIEAEIEVVRYDAGPSWTDLGFFDDLAAVIEDAVEEATAIPFLLFAGTDGRHLSRVGVQSYGFTPIQVGDLPFLDLVHSADERIPVETIEWGTERVVDAIKRYDG